MGDIQEITAQKSQGQSVWLRIVLAQAPDGMRDDSTGERDSLRAQGTAGGRVADSGQALWGGHSGRDTFWGPDVVVEDGQARVRSGPARTSQGGAPSGDRGC
jgi:hypothetical protein